MKYTLLFFMLSMCMTLGWTQSKGSVENINLGALYILSALTLVNDDAATSMPWLYESVRHI
jgi:hypothetical protein